MQLLEKIKRLIKMLCHRLVFVGVALILQLAGIIIFFGFLSSYSEWFYAGCILLEILIGLKIINDKSNPSYKIAWLIPILLVPIFGAVIYLVFGRVRFIKKDEELRRKVSANFNHALKRGTPVKECFSDPDDKAIIGQANYLEKYAGAPVYTDCYTEFFPLGENKFESMLTELANAKHFIFLEYFIIDEGRMWDTVLDLLVKKVKEGVEVRVLYDDMGCLFTLPGGYYKKLQELGIKAKACNPFIPVLTPYLNNRDHRKILVIDGHTGYTGGINLADEYINEYEKHGHWKDCSVMIKGKAVESLTAMFLSMWDVSNHTEEGFSEFAFDRYGHEMLLPQKTSGLVCPYGDSPLDDELVGENVYFNLIGAAKDYLYIETPYLILDHDMIMALSNASKRGVDVRIMTPYVADKWFVHLVTQSYYTELIEAGVKIYEYTPGFVHAKIFVSDDTTATVGTINLDYRSLYLHYECGVWMYRSDCIADIKADFLKTLEKCRQMSPEDIAKQPLWKRVCRPILKAFAPLL